MGDKFQNKAEFHPIFLVNFWLLSTYIKGNFKTRQCSRKTITKTHSWEQFFGKEFFRDKILNGFFFIR